MKWLDGKKTYLGFLVYGVLGLLFSMGVLNEQMFGVLISLNTAWTGISVRQAIKKSGR